MSHHVMAATSPLNCIWIRPGSRWALDACEFAICERLPDAPRVVNEAECAHCPRWEEPRHRNAARAGDVAPIRFACDTLPA